MKVSLKKKYMMIIILVISFLSPLIAYSQSSIPPEERPRPIVDASQLKMKPELDGLVKGDPAWEGLIPATGFTQIQPIEGSDASQKTEVFIGYTDSAFYIGLIAYDDNPDGIIVADSRRDSKLDDTDSFQVVIDGLLDRQNGFVFGTNPVGIEYDGQVTKEGSTGSGQWRSGGGAFNLNWNGSWNVVSKITDYGWTAEMEIPFTTLRYKEGEDQVWGINFQRNIRRNNEVTFWAPLSRQRKIYRVSAAGTVEGIKAPSSRNLQITPYFLGNISQGGSIDGTDNNQDIGIDVKYSLTPSLTLDATLNTDFAQVEVDEQVINLDRFSVFLPEKRPFFLENAGQFSIGNPREVQLFFSRKIGISSGKQIPIEGGLRLSGKATDTTNIGLLHMTSDAVSDVAPGNNYTVARVNQELPNRSSIGALITDRQGDGSISGSSTTDKNQTYAIDGQWGIGDNLLFSGWFAKTNTPEVDDKEDAFAIKMNYDSAKWNSRLNYTEVEANFNPELGFLSRKDYRKALFYLMRRIRPKDQWGLLEVRPHIMFQSYKDFNGFEETAFGHFDVHWEFKNGYRIDTGMNKTKEGVKEAFDIVDGATIQPGTYDHKEAYIVLYTNKGAPLSFLFRNTIGGRFGGDRVKVEGTMLYRIGETFSSELSVKYNSYDLPIPNGDFTANLTKLRLSYSFTPKILLQALIQHNNDTDVLSTNLRFSWLQTATSGLYIVYNEYDDSSIGALPKGKEFSIKYSYLFDAFQ